jgi:aldose 1-epimerase
MTEERFKICTEKFGDYKTYKLCDSASGEYASILPLMGGSINGLAFKWNNELVELIDGYKSFQEMQSNLTNSFKGSNLFPFPNRIANGTYSFSGKIYHLPVNFPTENSAIHGLVYDREFEVVKQENGPRSCSLSLRYYAAECCQGYPYKYMLEQHYVLKEDREFRCCTTIVNHSDCKIPVGHGWHPYFMMGPEKIDDLSLQFPAATRLDMDQRNIPTGNSRPYGKFERRTKIGNTVLDHCFRFNESSEYVDIVLYNKKSDYGFKIRPETGRDKYNFVQIFTPYDRRSIAIEPMTCAPDAFNNKEGLIIMEPGESLSLTFFIFAI